MRNLGAMGQHDFASLCQKAGLNAHAPNEDLFGWDFLVEAPHDFSAHQGMLDSVPAPIEFRVQVKATDGAKPGDAIALEQMLRLSALQMPVFFLFLAYAGGPDPVDGYLVHLDRRLISRTLQRARRLSASGGKTPGKAKLWVSPKSSDRLAMPLYHGLRQALAPVLSGDMKAYLVKKNELFDSVGFANPRSISNVTFKADATQDFIDVLLGLKDDVAVERITFEEFRFGIPRKFGPQGESGGRLSITKHHPRDITLEVRKDSFSPPLRIGLKWYALPDVFPEEQVRHRFAAPAFEFLLWPHTNRLDLRRTANANTRLPLAALNDLASLMHLLAGPRCEVALVLDGDPIFSGTAGTGKSEAWDAVQPVIWAAWRVATRVGVDAQVNTTLAALMDNAPRWREMAAIMAGEPARVEFEDRCCHTPGAKSAYLRTFDLALGDFHVAGVFAVVGETVETPTGFELSSDSVRLLRAFAKSAAQWEPAILGPLLKVCSDELEADGLIVIPAGPLQQAEPGSGQSDVTSRP
jgi:hypothetical protein